MGLGRQEFSATRVVLAGDSAVGPNARWDLYREDWDEKHLDLKPGEVPTRFTIHQCGEDQKRGLAGVGYDENVDKVPLAGIVLTLRCALKDWDNYQILSAAGIRCVDRPGPADWEDAGLLGRILTDAAIKRLGLTYHQRRFLYTLIFHFSEAQLPLSKPSAPPPGPPSQ